MSTYEELRQANIDRINALVLEIGLDITAETIKSTVSIKTKALKPPAPARKAKPAKRVREPESEDSDESSAPSKASKVVEEETGGTRRSSRAKAQVNYAQDSFDLPSKRIRSAVTGDVMTSSEDELEESSNRLGKRTQSAKQFGHIPGIPVGKWWEFRMQCSTDSVHAPPVSGISGNKDDGAWSIALSGGYEDDVDLGYAFTYTGAGGRALSGTAQNPKNLRTAPQSFDQTFDMPLNAALKKSSETKKPVRVIRGFKLPSKYAPESGYRYDGLYTVERAWRERGLAGFMVCKYALVRVPGQPPIPEVSE